MPQAVGFLIYSPVSFLYCLFVQCHKLLHQYIQVRISIGFQRHYNFRVLTPLHTGSLLFSPAFFNIILARVYIYRYELALEPMFDVVLILHLD